MFKNIKTHLYHNLKIIKPYNIIRCVILVDPETNIHVDCINYDKFNPLITYLDESIETNKQVLKVVEGEKL